MRTVAYLVIVVAVAVSAFLAGHASSSHGTHCPTEDSCSYSYSHHIGTVVPIVP